MIARRPFATLVARQAARLVRWTGSKAGGDRIRMRVRSLGLVWRRRQMGKALPLRGPMPVGAAILRETGRVLIQRLTEMHWMNVTGRSGSAGEPGAPGKAWHCLRRDVVMSTGKTRMIWPMTTPRSVISRWDGSDPGKPGLAGVPVTAINPVALRFGGWSDRSLGNVDRRSSRPHIEVVPSRRVMATLGTRPVLPPALIFRTSVRQVGDASVSGRRGSSAWRGEDRPSDTADGRLPVTLPAGQTGAVRALALEWRRVSPQAIGGDSRMADPSVGPVRLRGDAVVSGSVTFPENGPGVEPAAQLRSLREPVQPTASARFDASELARLADEVMRRIDKRERISRERAGR